MSGRVRWLLAVAGQAMAMASVMFWSVVARMRLRLHGAEVGRRLRVRGPIRLHCHRTGVIRIGDDCRMLSGFAGNAVGGGRRMALWVGPGGRLTIGDGVGLSNSTIVCMEAVSIGDGTFVGGDTCVYDTDFHSLDPVERSRPGNKGARTSPVRLGRHVFVGGHSIVLKGVAVGDTAVVGAGSVVRRDVPAGQVWAGNPAAFVRELEPSRGRRVVEEVVEAVR